MAADDGIAISIHALLAESDRRLPCPGQCPLGFLSTLSSRRATDVAHIAFLIFHISIHALLAESDRRSGGGRRGWLYFYPRSPRGERHREARQNGSGIAISIHALLAESDCKKSKQKAAEKTFLSTLSSRRATVVRRLGMPAVLISIHALLAESDCLLGLVDLFLQHFYPRSPRGERPGLCCINRSSKKFLSTLSSRRATVTSSSFWMRFLLFLSTLSSRRATSWTTS